MRNVFSVGGPDPPTPAVLPLFFTKIEALHDLKGELAVKDTTEHLPEMAIKLAAVIENKGEKSTTLLSIFSDLLTNNIKETKHWNDDTKLLFVVVLDYGGPALLRIFQEKLIELDITGPLLSLLMQLPYCLASG